MYCGVCSVSFRGNTPEEIIRAAANAKLDGIEWGSDVHVPPNDLKKAKEIHDLTVAAGLRVLSYGTYFGVDSLSLDDFTNYLNTADVLQTDILRIWPPTLSQDTATEIQYQQYVRLMREAAEAAEKRNKTLCFECHPNMLTEKSVNAISFIKDIGKENVKMYWQPNQFYSHEENLAFAAALSPYIRHIHTFFWRGRHRFPLEKGIAEWKSYCKAIASAQGEHVYLLEFMHDDRIESLNATAEALYEVLEIKGK